MAGNLTSGPRGFVTIPFSFVATLPGDAPSTGVSRVGRVMRLLAHVTSAVGKGLIAGAAGTAAMTLSSTIEAKVRNRKGSETPAEAICKLLGVETMGEKEKARLTNVIHWGYGTGLGLVRGALDVVGLSGTPAAAAFFATVWSGEMVTLPALNVMPAVTEWGVAEVGIDGLHHLVYAATASTVYELLDQAA